MKKFKLYKPLDWIIVTQPFGVNYVNFYQDLGMKGHNGEDYRCYEDKVYAAHDGIVLRAGKYSDGGIGIELLSDYINPDGTRFKTIYYHLKNIGKDVKKGAHFIGTQLIGISDNTGRYTTGNHLHFGLKLCDRYGNTLNWNNGYRGAIDPRPYTDKDYYKLPVHRKYGRATSVLSELRMRAKYPFISQEQLYAIVYGGYPYSEVINPSLKPIWTFLRREEYLRGMKPSFKLST